MKKIKTYIIILIIYTLLLFGLILLLIPIISIPFYTKLAIARDPFYISITGILIISVILLISVIIGRINYLRISSIKV